MLTIISSSFYIKFPNNIPGWVGLVLFTGLIAWGIYRQWDEFKKVEVRRWAILAALIIFLPFATLFLGIRTDFFGAVPLPNMPEDSSRNTILLLFSIPMALAAGTIGALPSLMFAGISGLLLALFETHHVFTVLEVLGLAVVFNTVIRQNYRTRIYRFLRHPLGAAVLASIGFAPVYILTTFFQVTGNLPVRLDYALTQSWQLMVTRGIELIIAGTLAEILLYRTKYWKKVTDLRPSPSEASLKTRFLTTLSPFVVLLVLALVISSWVVAGNTARKMIEDRLESVVKTASESLPYFLETGRVLIVNAEDRTLFSVTPEEQTAALQQRLRSVPFFRQIVLFDTQGNMVASYPEISLDELRLTTEEETGLNYANRIPVQNYIVAPFPGETSAQVSFLAAIQDDQGQYLGAILGRTDFNSNPFSSPVIQSMLTLQDINGIGMILDEKNQIIFHTNPDLISTGYAEDETLVAGFHDEMSSTGTRQLSYVELAPVGGWSIILSVPAEVAQQMALDIAIPLFIILALVTVLGVFLLRAGMNGIVSRIQTLASDVENISEGELDNPVRVVGVDEIGNLAGYFEQMRKNLKERLDELNQLLLVSQGVAANLNIHEAVAPILQAFLRQGAESARFVLDRNFAPGTSGRNLIAISAGKQTDRLSYLDGQIYDLVQMQGVLVIPNTFRIRRLNFQSGLAQPAAVIALPVQFENEYFGALWIAYDQPQNFNDEIVRFFSTLSSEAALATSNAHLYASAEIGKQRLEAILYSTPEPVLVVDAQQKILLINPAANQVSGMFKGAEPGKPVQEVIINTQLLDMVISSPAGRIHSKEIEIENGRVYFASISPVSAGDQPVGKVCLLRDITHYKELDALKSDFVATVSHDLRSPLTLMRGYATMLQMVGDLNEQQKAYSQKILNGVDNMGRLVNNLLDLGRIEAGVGLKSEMLNPVNIVDQVVATLQPQAIQKNIQLVIENQATDQLEVEADPALLQQAVYNLVENAIKYTPVGGTVKVYLESGKDKVLVSVHDNGIGIAPLDLPRVFEKFYRSGRREAYQQRGTGLGLAIVRSIAERHNGKVWVESQLGKGSAFYLELPTRHSSELD